MKNEDYPIDDNERSFVSEGGTEHWLVDRNSRTLTVVGGRKTGKVVRVFSDESKIDPFLDDNGLSVRER